jgi:hypothetical protein
MKRLPFVVKPKTSFEIVGNEDVGQIKLLKVNGRLAAERVELDEEEFRQTRLQLDILKLARDIANAEGMSVENGFTLLQSFNLSDPVLSKYLEPVSNLLERQLALMKAQDQAVTSVIRHRIVHVDEDGNDVLDAKGQNVIGMDDWDIPDTQTLTDPLISSIYQFYIKELNGGKDPSDNSDDGDEKKGKATTSKSKNSKKSSSQTGETSTGEFSPTEPEMTDSVQIDSDDNPTG